MELNLGHMEGDVGMRRLPNCLSQLPLTLVKTRTPFSKS